MSEETTIPIEELRALREDFERKYCLYAENQVADLIEEYTNE